MTERPKRTPKSAQIPAAPKVGDVTCLGLLATTVILAPLFLGGAQVWARLAIECAMAVVMAIWAGSAKRPLGFLLIPFAAAGIAFAQVIPLPDGLLVSLAPVSAGAWKVAAPDMWGTISLDPAATLLAGWRLFLGLGTAVVTADLARTLVPRRTLLRAIAGMGIVVWILAILFPIDKLDRVLLGFIDLKSPTGFWQTTVDPPWLTNGVAYINESVVGDRRYRFEGGVIGSGMGCYVSSNQFANCLVITVPILVAAWLSFSRDRVPPLLRNGMALVTFAAAIWTTGVIAESRAGTCSLVIATIVFFNLVVKTGWIRRVAECATWLSISSFVALCVVLYGPFDDAAAVFPESLQPRVAAVFSDPRVTAARVALRMFWASPFLGTGLDTFGTVFPRFHPANITLFYAHNDYAQFLAEAGLAGAALMGMLGFMVLQRAHRFYWRVPPTARVLEAGPWAALAGMAAHAAFDWNLHLPANALLAAVVGGICAATGGVRQGKEYGVAGRTAAEIARVLFLVGAVASVLPLTRAAVSENVERDLRAAVTTARLIKADPDREEAVVILSSALAAGERMRAWDSANSRLLLLLGQGYLHLGELSDGSTEAHMQASEAAFSEAKRRCGMIRGIPE